MVSFFGKIPALGDFGRINVDSAEAMELARWLESTLEPSLRHSCTAPANGLNFLLHPAGAQRALLGYMVPSQDKVGRVFPASVFTHLDGAQAAASLSSLPLAGAAFLDGARALAQGFASISPDQLEAQLAALDPAAAQAGTPHQDQISALLQKAPHLRFSETLFGPLSEERQFYAYSTLAYACRQAQELGADGPAVVVDCPGSERAHAVVWLEMVRRLMAGFRQAPDTFWTADGRTLVCFGGAPAALFVHLANAAPDSDELWPLTTTSATAQESAKAAMSATQQQTLSATDSSLEAVITAIAGT